MSNRPILLDYVQERKESCEVPFFYDREQDINIIKSAQGHRPFIDAPTSSILTITETRVKRESDDEEYACLELVTKTKADRERDDEEFCAMELLTKTSAERESDDESAYMLSELYSKTFVDRERDDEDDSAYNQ